MIVIPIVIIAFILGFSFLCALILAPFQKKAERAKTITNIPLQDELFKQNYTRVLNELKTIDKETFLWGDTLMDALEFLYVLHDIPDRRTEEEKREDREKYAAQLNENLNVIGTRPRLEWKENVSTAPLEARMWFFTWDDEWKLMATPKFIYGQRNKSFNVPELENNGHIPTISYDYRGIINMLTNGLSVPVSIFYDIVYLLTVRELKFLRYNYSWDRQESEWQRREKEMQEMYPTE